MLDLKHGGQAGHRHREVLFCFRLKGVGIFHYQLDQVLASLGAGLHHIGAACNLAKLQARGSARIGRTIGSLKERSDTMDTDGFAGPARTSWKVKVQMSGVHIES